MHLIGTIFNGWQSYGFYYFGFQVIIQQIFKPYQDVLIHMTAGYKLPVVESQAIVEKQLDIIGNKRFTMFINGLMQFIVNLMKSNPGLSDVLFPTGVGLH